MVDVVVTEFDDMVLGYWQGKFHNVAPQTEFANALLSGLQALQAQYPGLALRAAYVQACTLKPLQRAAASQTLQLLQRQHPGSREAAQAATWLSAWRAGDYRRCRKATP